MLTCELRSNQVRWKKMQLAAQHYEYTGLKPERIEQAIDADEEWLKAHPMRKGGRKSSNSEPQQ
jgi:hypothetical protein